MLQICYASQASSPFDANALATLLVKARAHNQSAGLSGLLLYENNSFIQLLEGEDRAVIATYNRIRSDTRHHDLAILFKDQIKRRSFESWDMGFFNADDPSVRQLPGFLDIFDKLFSAAGFRENGDKARLIFVQFRDGLWHRSVKIA